MKKNKDTKALLFEMVSKLDPNFNVNEAEDKWIQNAVNPEHKGYCTPMSKSTCTPKRKALARRFKKGINENFNLPVGSPEHLNQYKSKTQRLKTFMDELFNTQDFEVIDTLYRLLIDRKKANINALAEDHSPEYQRKAEELKGKIDFLFDNDHYDIIDKISSIIEKLLPYADEPEYR